MQVKNSTERWGIQRSKGVNAQEKQNNEVMATGVWSVWCPGLHSEAFIVILLKQNKI